jgi:hypothetical protein
LGKSLLLPLQNFNRQKLCTSQRTQEENGVLFSATASFSSQLAMSKNLMSKFIYHPIKI